MKSTSKLITGLALSSLAWPAFAGFSTAVSEPDTLTLLGVAGVVVAIAAIRRRRK